MLKGIPLGCGRSILGGGIAGPWGEVDNERAGDPGEYHHSRNLMKNIAVGNSRRRESSNRRGEASISRRNWASKLFSVSGDILFWAARLAARCQAN